jgi:hypothetical protein
MIRVYLTQCSYSKPGGESHGCFNNERFEAETLQEALERLERDYGIVPPKKPKGVFVDTPDRKAREVGFMCYRWGEIYDRSSDGPKRYWEENWISFDQLTVEPFSLPKELQAAY